jgi:phosphate uptake regulator
VKRKVIQLAGKTFVISLPSPWVKQWGVTKGDEIELLENGSTLQISTCKARDMKKCSVDFTHANERVIRWVLSSLHKKGYDEIEIATTGPDQEKIIDELLKDLFIGFAIVHKTQNSCIVRCLSKEFEDQFDIILRRAFLVTLSLAEQTADFVKTGKYDQLPALSSLEKNNNQLTNFCQRILNKRGHSDATKTTFLYVIIWNLEKIADEYKYLGQSLAIRKALGKNSLALLAQTNKLLRDYYELFYSFDLERLTCLAATYKKLQEEIEQAMVKEDPLQLSYLAHIVLKIADFSPSTVALHEHT